MGIKYLDNNTFILWDGFARKQIGTESYKTIKDAEQALKQQPI